MLPDIAEDALLCDYQMEGVKSSPCLKYEEEWLTLSKVDLEMTGLKEKIIDGELRASRFRSVIWRLLLGALTPGYPENWPEEARRSREHYKQLKESIEVTPSALSEPNRDNPLSTNERSSWHQYFCDKELKSLIRQDVIRTFPGIDFFRSEEIQQSMINILFCYARENPLMCYRQGMHEVLAPVIFVVKSDHHALLHTKEQIELRPDILDVVNPDYFEEDSYTLFRRIMNAIEGSYLISNVAPTSTGYFPGTSCSINTTENQVLAQLNWIKEHLLAPSDPELHDHLAKLDIPLPLFGIRWLRLLFGREFPLQDLLVLWDAIFAENRCFDLVNYIVVAMLSAVRKKLLDSDYANCLTTLMRYPGASDISLIIDYALYLKNPAVHKIPPKLIIPAPVRKTDQKTNKSVPNRSNAVNGNNKKLPTTQNHRPSPPNNVYKPNGTVIDGYLLNDPERLLKELKQSQSIMSLCSMKLVQYFNVLQKSVNHDDIQGQLALTGIQELSSLLSDNVRNGEAVSVEPALEAQEKTPTSIAPVTLRNDNVAPIPARPRSVDMTVFSRTFTPINDVDYEGKEFFLSSLKLS